MARRDLPPIYFDEHIKQVVIETFKEQGFKCLLIAKTKKYAGRDEKDYIEEIYAEGNVFATSDVDFFHYLLDNKIKHAGIVVIPPGFDNDSAAYGAGVMANILKEFIDIGGKNALRRLVFYIAEDGFRVFDDKGADTLLYSITEMERDLGIWE